MDVEGEDDDYRNDELFRRIIESEKKQFEHNYRLSFAQEVGSSFDPDMEDMAAWEQELSMSSSATPIASGSEPEPPIDLELDDDDIADMYEDYLWSQQEDVSDLVDASEDMRE